MPPSNNTCNNREAVFLALNQVPRGRVVTYGQLARLAGSPGAARWVGSILRQLPPDSVLPWHRVVNSRGEIASNSPAYLEQKRRLEQEGVALDKINLKIFGWAR